MEVGMFLNKVCIVYKVLGLVVEKLGFVLDASWMRQKWESGYHFKGGHNDEFVFHHLC